MIPAHPGGVGVQASADLLLRLRGRHAEDELRRSSPRRRRKGACIAVSIRDLRFLAPYVPFPCVKFLIPLLILATPLHAKLLATFHTTQGDVVVELQYDKTPLAVANFIGLAQGTRSWFDEETGAVVRKPFYIGEKFYRIENTTLFKIAQSGSGTGTTSGGPGYKFRDEFDDSLLHVPYVLSMANGGPNTNGSQIFLTGNVSISHLDKVHTVFGLVSPTDTDSQTVIDAIMAAGSNGTTITGISFHRTDEAAVAFDENAQALPRCSGAPGKLNAVPGGAVGYQFQNAIPAGSLLQNTRSFDLQSWSLPISYYSESGEVAGISWNFDIANSPRAFYNISLINFPNALRQSSIGNRTLTAELEGDRTLVFQFGADGTTGTITDTNSPGQTFNFVSNTYIPNAYGATLQMNTNLVNNFFRIVCGFDSETTENVIGRHSMSRFTNVGYVPYGSGTLTLTKP